MTFPKRFSLFPNSHLFRNWFHRLEKSLLAPRTPCFSVSFLRSLLSSAFFLPFLQTNAASPSFSKTPPFFQVPSLQSPLFDILPPRTKMPRLPDGLTGIFRIPPFLRPHHLYEVFHFFYLFLLEGMNTEFWFFLLLRCFFPHQVYVVFAFFALKRFRIPPTCIRFPLADLIPLFLPLCSPS